MKSQSEHSRVVGEERERKVLEVLQLLKEQKLIKDFMRTGKLSFADVKYGIDFYIVRIAATYVTVPISVTGPQWAEEHRMQHPNVPVIVVDLSIGEPALRDSILSQILSILESN